MAGDVLGVWLRQRSREGCDRGRSEDGGGYSRETALFAASPSLRATPTATAWKFCYLNECFRQRLCDALTPAQDELKAEVPTKVSSELWKILSIR
jgi:hypothetical protein